MNTETNTSTKFTYACGCVIKGGFPERESSTCLYSRSVGSDEDHAAIAEEVAATFVDEFCNDETEEFDVFTVAVLCLETGARWIVTVTGEIKIAWKGSAHSVTAT